MGSPPNRTADRARRSTSAGASCGGVYGGDRGLSLRLHDAQAGGSSARSSLLLPRERERGGAPTPSFVYESRARRSDQDELSGAGRSAVTRFMSPPCT